MSSILQIIPKTVLRMAGPILLLVLLATWLLLRRRRRGTTPHCRRCDYNLTGLSSERCPECGAELTPAGIVYGERVRRRWPRVLAVVCAIAFVPPAVEFVQWARQYDWYRLRPTSWVLSDLETRQPLKPWYEIQRRVQAGSLSPAQHNRLIEDCLREQAAPKAFGPMIDYLEPCLLDGRMTQSQKDRFFRQIVRFELVARPKVVAGRALPIEVRQIPRCPYVVPDRGMSTISPPNMTVRTLYGSHLVDGRPPGTASRPTRADEDIWAGRAPWPSWPSAATSFSVRTVADTPTGRVSLWYVPSLRSGGVAGRSANPKWQIDSFELGRDIAPGRHRLTIPVKYRVLHGAGWWSPYETAEPGAATLHEAELSLDATFEILATEPPDYIRLISDPSLKPALLSAITVRRAGWHETPATRAAEWQGKEYMGVSIGWASLPVNVAFDAIVRVGGKEYRGGRVVGAKGQSGDGHIGVKLPKDTKAFDLILRSSKEAAEATVDLFEIWRGELVYRIDLSNTTTQPVTGPG